MGTVEVAGETLAIRSLTRAEALEFRDIAQGPDAYRLGEVFLITHGFMLPDHEASPEQLAAAKAEAAAWWDASDAIVVQKLVQAIGVVSRITGDDGASDPKPAPSARSSKAG